MPNTCQQDPTVEYKTDIEEPMSSRALLRPRVLTRDPPSDPPGTPSNISPKKQIPGHHRREQRVAFEKNSVKELMYRVILFFPYVAIMIMCKVLVSNTTEHETSVVSLHGATQERAEATTMTAPTGSRPWMVVHVGPPKTATTTIKKGLLEVAEKLALDDNVYFVGGIQSSRVDVNVNVGVDTEFKVYRNADTFPSNHESAMQSNFEEFSQALEGHLRNGHNVVISNDMYTHADGLDWDKLFEGIFLKKNQTTSANDGFRVKVVVGYDHLFRWLPSMYYRDYLKYPYLFADPDGNPREYANAYIPGLIEFIESSLDSVVQYDHNVVEASSEVSNPSATVTRNNYNPLYAQVKGTRFKQFKQVLNGIHGSVWAYLKFMTRPELSDAVDVFDVLHQEVVSAESILDTVGHKKSVVTNFVCQALPSADKTCMHLLIQDNTKTNTETRNFPEMQAETFRTSKADRRITFPDMHRITQHARVVFRNTKTSLELYQSGRPEWDLYNAIDEWFHDPLNPNRAQTFKVCMDSNLAAKYKSVSWKFLVQMALLTKYRHTLNGNTTANDSLFASSMPRDRSIFFQNEAAKDDTIEQDDLLWLAQTKEEHDRAFDEYVGGGTYDNTIKMCQLDVVALFEDKEFVEYFSNIQQRPARHKTKHIKKVAKKSGTLKDEKLSKRTKNGTSMFIS